MGAAVATAATGLLGRCAVVWPVTACLPLCLQDGRIIPFGLCVWSTGVGPTDFILRQASACCTLGLHWAQALVEPRPLHDASCGGVKCQYLQGLEAL